MWGRTMMDRRLFAQSALAAVVAGLEVPVARAQSVVYPNRIIRIVVPFAAGGGVDIFARLLAEKLKDTRGAALVVENRGGGNGTVGGKAVLQSEPDGYTLLFSAATHVMARHVMRNAPYD